MSYGYVSQRHKTDGAGFAALIAVAAIVPLTIYNGWVLSVLWNWFIPNIFGLKSLAIGEAIGLSLVISAFVRNRRDEQDNEYDSPLTIVLKSLLTPIISGALMLITGWVVHAIVY